ncbi:type I restriction endonuclease subunit R [Bacteroidales bacterium OttesenSCG-928-B11]|nr:type I restriction endonuclease subunit R [Bacteroidales bacterium OttesenSCG-928-B11]MDL2326511.1 type I restriction endonuclease subunit R [Bacteroidales bacterium OttesenSCG-928-A14]
MSFNELNSVEHFIIKQLSGVDLNNNNSVAEPQSRYGVQWEYLPASSLLREQSEVLVESELKRALIRLNKDIANQPDRADEVIYKLRTILLSVNSIGLVRANEEFTKWMRGEMTMPFGKNYSHVPVRLIDFDNLQNNTYQIVNQLHVRNRETKIPDIVLFVNGIPVVVGEAKTPVRPAVSWFDGAHEIHNVYENAVPALFVPNVLSFATDGKEFFYGAVRTPLEHWSPWRLEKGNDDIASLLGLNDVGAQIKSLLSPRILLDILCNFSIFTNNKRRQRIKVVCRYQQYEGANLIVERVKNNQIKKGLIWHFQGSGKSLLMLFAAQKLRREPQLKSPTVLIVVDRTDLDTQIAATFNAANVPNMVTTDSIKELHDYLERDARFIILTMIHKFKDAYANMNLRDNIIVMVDEAHRTQEGNLGQKMRAALPNAFLFGLTGTPINRADKNTFWAFGAEDDENGYMSRYSFQDSIRDNATLPLHFEPRLLDIHIDNKQIDIAFDELANDLDEEQKAQLSKTAAQMAVFLKSPQRIQRICEDIVTHFKEKVEPHGFKAMIVTPDREACDLYKTELDKHLSAESSAVVISTSANDDYSFKEKYQLDKDQQEKLIELYNKPESSLKFLIVTAKLLTGFDAPILQTMYLDKSLKDHTLLQAICRTNRLYPQKTFGCIVDYFGVFDDTARALQFDEETVKTIISNLAELRTKVPQAVEDALSHFPNIDRTIEGFEGLQAAQDCINTNEKRDAFAKDYIYLSKLWESLSPDDVLLPFTQDYTWLSNVYASVKPTGPEATGKLLWMTFGAQTTKLIHENIHVENIHDDLEMMVLDETVMDDLMNTKNPKKIKQIEKELIKRFQRNANKPQFVELSKRLEDLRLRAEQGLITSIDFIKELVQLARETVQAEKEEQTKEERKDAKTALTELFLEIRTEDTPAVVGRIVDDIDNIVKIVRFPGWQNTVAGEREVQKALRKTLLKYKLHKEEELFNKAYLYIKEYY